MPNIEPLTHRQVVFIVQAAISQAKLAPLTVCQLGGLNFNQFAKILTGELSFTPRVLAGVGLAVNMDFSSIAASYAAWEYTQGYWAAVNTKEVPRPAKAPPAGQEFRELVEMVARQNPNATSELLVSEVCGLVPMPRAMVEQEIILMLAQRRAVEVEGEYGRI